MLSYCPGHPCRFHLVFQEQEKRIVRCVSAFGKTGNGVKKSLQDAGVQEQDKTSSLLFPVLGWTLWFTNIPVIQTNKDIAEKNILYTYLCRHIWINLMVITSEWASSLILKPNRKERRLRTTKCWWSRFVYWKRLWWKTASATFVHHISRMEAKWH